MQLDSHLRANELLEVISQLQIVSFEMIQIACAPTESLVIVEKPIVLLLDSRNNVREMPGSNTVLSTNKTEEIKKHALIFK